MPIIIGKITESVSDDIYFMFYKSNLNSVFSSVIPVAMLNPEFFGDNNQVLNYARIGIIIGHEITHGFDKYGQMYDKDGAVHSWSSHSNFENYSKCFVEQYSKYYVKEIESYVSKLY